ncbi:MAG: hypothetical protein AAFQ45_02040 [Pseudomonadota bacterium]
MAFDQHIQASKSETGETRDQARKRLAAQKEAKAARKFMAEREWHVTACNILVMVGLVGSVFANMNVMTQGLAAEMARDSIDVASAMWQATAICGTITVCNFISWHVFFTLGPRMLRNWAGVLGYLAIVAFTGMTVIVSSALNYQGLVYLNTLPRYLLAETNKMATVVDELTIVSREAKGLVPALSSLETDACTIAEREATTGFASGTGGGFGPAAAAFTSACAGSRGLRDAIEASIAGADQKAAALSAKIESLLLSVEDRLIPIQEREDAFRRTVAELDTLMRSYRNGGLGFTVKAGIGTLRNLVAGVDETSGLKGSARAAINGLRDKLQAVATSLEQVLASDTQAASYKRPERPSLGSIARQYVSTYPSHVAIAVFLDVWPLFIYSFLLLVGVGTYKPGKRNALEDHDLAQSASTQENSKDGEGA